MKKRILTLILMSAIAILMLTSCNVLQKSKAPLDPQNPITITVWNYYNGSVKDKFDGLVAQFNETVGTEHGIVVEAQSYGDVNELANAVFESAGKEIGSLPMPDIFAAYPDNAFRIDQIAKLVPLTDYFTQEELSSIKEEFLSEGIFGEEQALKILPIAKSTENLFINKTYWDTFAAETGASLSSLETWEGLVETAKRYYEHTGRAFFNIDANANYTLVSAMQLGQELYLYDGDTAKLHFDEAIANRIWQNYYVPYLYGYFAKSGRFSSDDAKTGNVVAYTGSTAGASYFPTEVAKADRSIPVEVITLPYPYFEGAKPYAIQQGAGMCIVKSDTAHEYAASIFLKWFISLPQNIEFAVSTAYLPVKTEALDTQAILQEMNRASISNSAVKESIITTIKMLQTHTLYGNKPFHGSYNTRVILESNLFNRVKNDLEILNKRVSKGESREDVLLELCSKEQFLNWYHELNKEIQTALQ